MPFAAKLLPLVAAMPLLAACIGDSPADRAARDSTSVAVAPEDSVVPAEAAQRARSAANALGRDLQAKLFAALDSGGPAQAVSFCADSAQALSDRHATAGVYLRRVSLRVRNPANRPDSAEAMQLRRLDSLHRVGALPGEVVRNARTADGRPIVEYMRPIMVQERCLACHGPVDSLAPGVRPILDARYPEDAATGYRAGDLRGMISVRVPRTLR